MKTIRTIMTAMAVIGLVSAAAMADSLNPTSKELISSVVIVAMSVTLLLVSRYIKNLSHN